MIKHSLFYSLFILFKNAWSASFIRRLLFNDFGLERKFQAGLLGRSAERIVKLSVSMSAFLSRIVKESWLFGACAGALGKASGVLEASLFAGVARTVLSQGITCVLIFALAFLTPLVPTKIVLALCVLIALSFFAEVFVTGTVKLRFHLLDLFVVLFAALLLYSVFISYNIRSSAVMSSVYILFILVYMAVKNSVDTPVKLKAVFVLIVLSGALVALYGVYQKLTGNFIATEAWIDAEMFESATVRIYSTLDNPNVLGEFLIFIIPMAFAILYYVKNNLHRLLVLGVLGITALCMVYTQSRGAWLGLIFAFSLFALLNDRRLVLLGIIGLFLMPFVLPSSIIERFTSIGNMADGSTNYRVNIWLACVLMIKKFWPIGIGLGEDTFVYIYRLFAFNAVYAPHSHNLYLQIAIGLGIAGIVTFACVMLCFSKNLLITINGNKALKAGAAALLAGMAGYLVQGLTDYVWYNNRIVAMFWIMVALSGAMYNILKSDDKPLGNNELPKKV